MESIMTRITAIFLITVVLTIVTLVYASAYDSVQEINKPIPAKTAAEKRRNQVEIQQPEASKPMMSALSQGYIRVSLSLNGEQLNKDNFYPSISGDGRYIAFKSWDDKLSQGVPIYDRQAKKLSLFTDADYSGSQFTTIPDLIRFNANGRYIVFSSSKENLTPGDLNGRRDIFVYDTQTNTRTLVSIGNNSHQGTTDSINPSISADGRYVAFESAASFYVHPYYGYYWYGGSGKSNIFVRDLQTKDTSFVSPAYENKGEPNDHCTNSRISADGRYVVYQSSATNLISNDENGSHSDIFVRDLQQNKTVLVSVASNGTQGDFDSYDPSISADGRYVAFISTSSNLAPNMKYLDQSNLFVRDLKNNTTVLITTNFGERPVRGLRNLYPRKTGDGDSRFPSISGDGRYVVFMMMREGWDNKPFDIVIHDLSKNVSTRIASGMSGPPNHLEYAPSISSNGNYVAFASEQDNFVSGDTNGKTDVFVFYQNLSRNVVPENLRKTPTLPR